MGRGCIEECGEVSQITEDWQHSPCGIDPKRVQMICDNSYYGENGGEESWYVSSRGSRKEKGSFEGDGRVFWERERPYSEYHRGRWEERPWDPYEIQEGSGCLTPGNRYDEANESIQMMFRCLSLEVSPSLLDDPFGSSNSVPCSPYIGKTLESNLFSEHSLDQDLGKDPGFETLRSPYSRISMDPRYKMYKIFDKGGGEFKECVKDISVLLNEIKAGKRKYTSYEILDVVIELSKDQYGSRYIQKILEESEEMERDAIFIRIEPYANELMIDVFGNYVIQRFIELGTEKHRQILLGKMKGEIQNLSLHTYGCRVVQKALECLDSEKQKEIVNELMGRILVCINDQNGNHVIQKCVEMVSSELVGMIIDEFRGRICELTTHPYGCRVIQRVFEHCSYSQVSSLLKDISGSIVDLSKDQYGNYVVQYIFDRGERGEIESVIKHLRGRFLELSRHKFASNVVEKFISKATKDDLSTFISEILLPEKNGEPALMILIRDQYGNYVIQKLLDSIKSEYYDVLVSQIRSNLPALKKSQYSKHIVSKIEKYPIAKK